MSIKSPAILGRLLNRDAPAVAVQRPPAAPEPPIRDVALVLSSGGARGLAHIGAIDALLEQGYRVTSVAGTSFGAIVAAMYASGHLDDFRRFMEGIDRRRMLELTDYSLTLSYFIKGERIIRAMQAFCPDQTIETLPVPFCCVATDWKTGREVVFRKGSMWRAIRASMSVPGTYAPVESGDMILIDGGITNPLPLNRVARTGRDLLVGVNVSGHDYGKQWERRQLARMKQVRSSRALTALSHLIPDALRPGVNYYNLIDRAMSIAIAQNAHRQIQLTPPDILVDIPMARYGGGDYDKYRQIYHVGYRKARMQLTQHPVHKSV